MTIELSIVICTRNRATKLEPMLTALGNIETQRSWEVLLVDNASTDETASVLRAADDIGGRLKLLHASQVGLGAARDFAWRHAKGDIIAFTDDDCYVTPSFVDDLLHVFAERQDVAGVGGKILLFDPDDFPITIDERDIVEDVRPFSYVQPGALTGANMAFRREALSAVNGFDPALGAGTPFPCEDIDIVAAISWQGMRLTYDPRPTVYHHHGRKAADFPNLMRGYDRGRGAYIAKYLLPKQSRTLYFKGWLSERFADVYSGSLAIAGREIGSAVKYYIAQRRYIAAAITAPASIAIFAALSGKILLNRALRPKSARI